MKKFLPFLFSACLFSGMLSAQTQDPVILCANVTVDGMDVTIDVEVENFVDIGSFQFGVGWENSKYTFVGVDDINEETPAMTNQVTENVPDAISLLRTLWFDLTAITPITHEDGTKLFTVNLQLNDSNEMGLVGVTDSNDFMIEFSNGNADLVAVEVNNTTCSTLAFNSIVNIDDLTIQEFEVSPNPFNDKLTINVTESLDGTFSVFSTTGKLMKSNIPAQGTEVNLELPGLVSGAYILKYVSTDNLTQGQIKIFKI